MRSIARKIKDLRLSLGLKQPEFAKALTDKEDEVDQSTVSKWENGRQKPKARHTARIAALAGVSVEEFLGIDRPGGGGDRMTVPITGEIQAGAWSEAVEWPEDDWREVNLPMITEWAKFSIHARQVVGNSMNRVYPDGSIVYVVPLPELGRMPNSGEHVVVQRVSDDGEYEVTLKEYIAEDGGKVYLWPRSTDPQFQAPIEFKKGRRGVDRVEIIGLVVMATVLTAAARVPAKKRA